jgi:hypothetical protein
MWAVPRQAILGDGFLTEIVIDIMRAKHLHARGTLAVGIEHPGP